MFELGLPSIFENRQFVQTLVSDELRGKTDRSIFFKRHAAPKMPGI